MGSDCEVGFPTNEERWHSSSFIDNLFAQLSSESEQPRSTHTSPPETSTGEDQYYWLIAIRAAREATHGQWLYRNMLVHDTVSGLKVAERKERSHPWTVAIQKHAGA